MDGESHWYKFDDGDVSECIMDDDEVFIYVHLYFDFD